MMNRLSRAQVREIDRRAIEEYHIPGIVLMENAAGEIAREASLLMRHNPSPQVVIVCGGGNNGGDGLAAARKLHNYGWTINLVVATTKDFIGDAWTNHRIVRQMKIPETSMGEAGKVVRREHCHLIVDALFGTGLTDAPRPEQVRLIELMNLSGLPILAVDVPSGLDCDTGLPLGACIRANRTITFVDEKVGFAELASRQYTGEITVGDIGVPRELIDDVARSAR